QELKIDYELFRGRHNKVTGVGFIIRDKAKPKALAPKKEDKEPTPEEIDQLPHAKRRAYQQLVEFGVFSGIAFYQIIPTIKGEPIQGYEDYFIELAIEHFNGKSKNRKKAGTFVDWWHNKRSYDSVKGKDWGKITEQIMARKKKLQETNPEAYDNREEAKNMTYTEFVAKHTKATSTAEEE
ncbi:MAG: hypothetical protein AAFY76_12965, partial [Cyanobacteria bacterium J06649_11]